MKQDIMQEFFDQAVDHLTRIREEERDRIDTVAKVIADQIEKDKLIYIWARRPFQYERDGGLLPGGRPDARERHFG